MEAMLTTDKMYLVRHLLLFLSLCCSLFIIYDIGIIPTVWYFFQFIWQDKGMESSLFI